MSIKQTVWKFPSSRSCCPSLQLPVGTKIIAAGVQDGRLMLWGLVSMPDDQYPEYELRCFDIVGTGTSLEPIAGVVRTHIATVFDGPFVWHIFERLDSDKPTNPWSFPLPQL